MTDPKIPRIQSIDLPDALKVSPGISKGVLMENGGTRHLILFARHRALDNAVLLGKVNEHTSGSDLSNVNVWIDISRPKVIIVFGRRGSGKSYDLGLLSEGLASCDSVVRVGSATPPVLIFDPLNQFWTLGEIPESGSEDDREQLDALSRWGFKPSALGDVVVVSPTGTASPFARSRHFTLDVSSMDADDWCDLFGVDKYLDPIGQLLSTAVRKVTVEGYHARRGQVAPKTNYQVADLANCVKEDPEINDPTSGFSSHTVRAVASRLIELSNSPLFSGEADISAQEMFRPGRVAVFMLRGVDEATRSLIVSQILKGLLQARGEQRDLIEVAKRMRLKAMHATASNPAEATRLATTAEALERDAESKGYPPGWVLIDEAHTICPREGRSKAKSVLIEYAKQGRSLGLSLVCATQQPSALDSQLISQRDLLLIHHLGIKADVDAALSQANPSFPQSISEGKREIEAGVPQYILNSLKSGSAIVSCDELSRNFVVLLRPRVTVHGGKEPIFK